MSLIKVDWDKHNHIMLAPNAPTPSREPDCVNNWSKFWFNEMLTARSKSDGRWETYLLAECPVTRKLMYFTGYYSLCWDFVQEKEVNEAYEEWLQKLCDKHFTS